MEAHGHQGARPGSVLRQGQPVLQHVLAAGRLGPCVLLCLPSEQPGRQHTSLPHFLLSLPASPAEQVTFVPPGFTRKPPKYERFIRPTGLRMNKASAAGSTRLRPPPSAAGVEAGTQTPVHNPHRPINRHPIVYCLQAHVTHPELKATFQLEILGVKKNPNGQAYTGLGVVTKGEPPLLLLLACLCMCAASCGPRPHAR